MQVCAACSRHVLPDAAGCPFCGAALRSTLLIPGVLLGLVLGLAAVACTERKPDDTASASGTSDATMTGDATTDAVTEASTSGDSTTVASADSSATVPTVTGDSDDSTSGSTGSSGSTDTGATTQDTSDTLPMPYGAPPPRSAALWV